MKHITGDYYVDKLDKHNLVVLEKYIVQTGDHEGDERFSHVSYHSRLDLVLKSMLDKGIAEEYINGDLKRAVAHGNKLYKKFNETRSNS